MSRKTFNDPELYLEAPGWADVARFAGAAFLVGILAGAWIVPSLTV